MIYLLEVSCRWQNWAETGRVLLKIHLFPLVLSEFLRPELLRAVCSSKELLQVGRRTRSWRVGGKFSLPSQGELCDCWCTKWSLLHGGFDQLMPPSPSWRHIFLGERCVRSHFHGSATHLRPSQNPGSLPFGCPCCWQFSPQTLHAGVSSWNLKLQWCRGGLDLLTISRNWMPGEKSAAWSIFVFWESIISWIFLYNTSELSPEWKRTLSKSCLLNICRMWFLRFCFYILALWFLWISISVPNAINSLG